MLAPRRAILCMSRKKNCDVFLESNNHGESHNEGHLAADGSFIFDRKGSSPDKIFHAHRDPQSTSVFYYVRSSSKHTCKNTHILSIFRSIFWSSVFFVGASLLSVTIHPGRASSSVAFASSVTSLCGSKMLKWQQLYTGKHSARGLDWNRKEADSARPSIIGICKNWAKTLTITFFFAFQNRRLAFPSALRFLRGIIRAADALVSEDGGEFRVTSVGAWARRSLHLVGGLYVVLVLFVFDESSFRAHEWRSSFRLMNEQITARDSLSVGIIFSSVTITWSLHVECPFDGSTSHTFWEFWGIAASVLTTKYVLKNGCV